MSNTQRFPALLGLELGIWALLAFQQWAPSELNSSRVCPLDAPDFINLPLSERHAWVRSLELWGPSPGGTCPCRMTSPPGRLQGG